MTPPDEKPGMLELRNPEGSQIFTLPQPRVSNIAAAICAVMLEVGYIKETGYNQHAKYKFASDEDLLKAIQPAMAKNGLCLVPSSSTMTVAEVGKGDRQNYRTDINMRWMLLHTSGEVVHLQMHGQGCDTQDKGVYKAQTGALKYALRHLFMIPTGDDAERANASVTALESVKPARPREQEKTVQEPVTRSSVDALDAVSAEMSITGEDLEDLRAWAGRPPYNDVSSREHFASWMATHQHIIDEWVAWWSTMDTELAKAGATRKLLSDWTTAGSPKMPVGVMAADKRKKLLELFTNGDGAARINRYITKTKEG